VQGWLAKEPHFFLGAIALSALCGPAWKTIHASFPVGSLIQQPAMACSSSWEDEARRAGGCPTRRRPSGQYFLQYFLLLLWLLL
jgi:hypothetical protein